MKFLPKMLICMTISLKIFKQVKFKCHSFPPNTFNIDKKRTEGLWCVMSPLYIQFDDFCEFV